MAHQNPRKFVSLLALVSVLLAACSVTQEVELDTSGSPKANEWFALSVAAESKAAALAATADELKGDSRVDARLRAADQYLLASRYDLANNQLAKLREADLDANNKVRFDTLRSRMAVPPAPRGNEEAPAAEVARQLADRADRLAANNYLLPAIRLRVLRGVLLSEENERQRNDNAIWSLVRRQSKTELATLPDLATDELVSWWSLGYLQASTAADQQAAAYRWWQQRYPGYAQQNAVFIGLTGLSAGAGDVAAGLPTAGGGEIEPLAVNPSRVALLLPMTGRYSPAAEAIEAGFRAADLTQPIAISDLQIVDSEARGVVEAYDEAVTNGAELVIGPLRKPAVTQLLARGFVSSTVLTLNDPEPAGNRLSALDSAADSSDSSESLAADAFDSFSPADNAATEQLLPPGVVIYGLSPEQEAGQIARRALAEGKRRTALLLPANDWGSRVGDAFAKEFLSGGGAVVARGDYRPGVNDLGRDVAELLQAKSRRPLWRDVGGFASANRSVYEGSQRQRPWSEDDQQIDMVFMAAFPRDARILRPSLKFHEAIRLPVYATSHVYSGRPNPQFDADLDGIIFCDMPELLQPPEQRDGRQDSNADSRLKRYPPRLVALGRDARLLVDNLALLRADPGSQLSGATGRLKFVNDRIVRELGCAKFVDGVAQPLPEPGMESLMDEQPPVDEFGSSQPL